jgi:hypothetical protein
MCLPRLRRRTLINGVVGNPNWIEARLSALGQARGISPPVASVGGLPPLPGTDIIIHQPSVIDGNGYDPTDKPSIIPVEADERGQVRRPTRLFLIPAKPVSMRLLHEPPSLASPHRGP